MSGAGVSQAEFAELKGWHRSRVSQLKKLKPSPIVFTESGLVDVDKTEEQLAKFQQADKQGVRERHQRDRALKSHEVEVLPASGMASQSPPADASGKKADAPRDDSFARFNAARAQREEENLALARMAREEREGLLVRKDDVLAAAGDIGQLLIQRLESLSVKVAPGLAAETDPVACQAIIDQHVRQLRADLANKLRALFADKVTP